LKLAKNGMVGKSKSWRGAAEDSENSSAPLIYKIKN
jgi:hypothetical protein